jgi:hypothetical protein
MPPLDTCLVRVITRAAQRPQSGLELPEHRLLPGAHPIREHAPRVRIKGRPEPPLGSFGPHQTPQFIPLSCAPWSDADGAGA